MATSGTYNFNLTTLNIITMAFQEINIYGVDDEVNSKDYTYALNKLNLMLKSWEIHGIRLWKRRQATLFPDYQTSSYQIGSVSGADNVTQTYVNSTVDSAAVAGVSTLILDDATGFTMGMNVGIELDNNTRQWTTIATVGGNTITLNSPITESTSVGNTVVAYTSKINRPLQIIRGTVDDLKSNNTETVVQSISFDAYLNMPLKSTLGQPCNFYYDRLLNNSLPYTGTLYLFPSPDVVSKVFNFTYYDSVQDMVNSNETSDLPQEWLPAIVKGLAADLCLPYGKTNELQIVGPQSQALLAELESFDSDDTSLNFRVDRS